MTDKNILNEFYWFSVLSDESFDHLLNDTAWDIKEKLENINNLINYKVTRILSLLSDEEISIINNTDCFDDIVVEFEWIDNFSENEYDILEERFRLSRGNKKESEK
jgi:hypothetical protein